jgi:hypothetical protein
MNKFTPCRNVNERGWAKLLNEINNGNVVPIIGNELLKFEIDNKQILLKDFLVQKLAEKIDVEYKDSLDITQLSGVDFYSKWKKINSDPYFESNLILKDFSFKTPDSLHKLLSIDKFNLILTTTFDSTVEKAMEEKWGKGKFKKHYYKKGKGGQDDIKSQNEPTLYQMFGKIDINQNSFVLTEDDLLEFLHYWLNDDYKPKELSRILKEKYLLVIGCNYPNWLFRFFLNSMRFPNKTVSEGVIVADSYLDDELIAFLSRMDAEMHDNAVKFIDELVNRWSEFKNTNIESSNEERLKNEVFISYASEDEDLAAEVVETFRKQGMGAWFDKKELEPADEYAKKIRYDIQSCKAFIPILSKNTITKERRFFKREWNWAIEETEWRTGNFIFPIIADETDIHNELIPKEFSKLQIIDSCKEDFSENIKKAIRKIRS